MSDRSAGSIRGLKTGRVRRVAWKNDFSSFVTSSITLGDKGVKANANA